jgi:hypothetical protein
VTPAIEACFVMIRIVEDAIEALRRTALPNPGG